MSHPRSAIVGSRHIGQIHLPILVFLFFDCFVDVGESSGSGRFREELESMSVCSVGGSELVDIVIQKSYTDWRAVENGLDEY